MGGMIDINITLLIQLANFLVLMFVLDRLFYRPLLKAMDGRKARVEGLRAEARQLRSDLEAEKEDYEERMDRARTLAVPIRLEQRAEAYETYRGKLAAARDEANRVLADELAELDEHREKAWADLSARIDAVSDEMTERLLADAKPRGGAR